MDRRTVLALVLVAAVILLTPRFFGPPVVPPPGVTDTTSVDATGVDTAPRREAQPPPVPSVRADTAIPEPVPAAPLAPPETLVVSNGVARYHFTNVGGVLQSVDLLEFRDLSGGDGVVTLRGQETPLIRFFAIAAGDTIHFDTLRYAMAADTAGPGGTVTMTAGAGADSLTLRF